MKRVVVLSILVLALILGTVGAAQAIKGGQSDNDGHPYVGALVIQGSGGGVGLICSGVAISDHVLVTAAHCFPENTETVLVTFASNLLDPSLDLHEGTWTRHPDFDEGRDCGNGQIAGTLCNDVAVVVFQNPLGLARYASLPDEGQVDSLPNGTGVTIVGYGDKEFSPFNNPPTPLDQPRRLVAQTSLVPSEHLIKENFIKLKSNKKKDTGGVCFGDSGGPDLLGDTDTILAINSFVLDGPKCDGVTYSLRLDTEGVLDFINSFLD